jgi:hypothetical protein
MTINEISWEGDNNEDLESFIIINAFLKDFYESFLKDTPINNKTNFKPITFYFTTKINNLETLNKIEFSKDIFQSDTLSTFDIFNQLCEKHFEDYQIIFKMNKVILKPSTYLNNLCLQKLDKKELRENQKSDNFNLILECLKNLAESDIMKRFKKIILYFDYSEGLIDGLGFFPYVHKISYQELKFLEKTIKITHPNYSEITVEDDHFLFVLDTESCWHIGKE